MPLYTEESLQNAVKQALEDGNTSKASRDWKVPRSSIQNRIKGYRPPQLAHTEEQNLTLEQETRLAIWVKAQFDLGLPPNHSQIKGFANQILQHNGRHYTVGRHWMERFLKRNPILKTMKAKRISHMHINGATTTIIKSWFNYLQIPQIKKISP